VQRRLTALRFAIVVVAGAAAGRPLASQRPDSASPPARFLGRLVNSLDSTPVRSADIRLLFVDSVRTLRTRRGDSLDIFVDSARSRVTTSDSVGAFAVRRLAAGHYLMHVRRIGFKPISGALTVDTGAVEATFRLEATSVLLAKVEIKEMSLDRAREKLDRNGFLSREHSGESGTFIDRADIIRRQPQTVAELLRFYGVSEGDVLVDRMPLDFRSLEDYPADLVLGVEIYRHGRPTEFNGTRNIPTLLSPGGVKALMAPLVVIWTFIP
jgi:hypothetical protein